MSRQPRRAFLKGAAGLGAAVAVAGSEAAHKVLGVEKPVRMRYCKCNETFKDWPQEKIFKFIAECGYGGVEIAPFTISTGEPSVPHLIDFLKSDDTHLRIQAATILGRIGSAAGDAIPALERALHDQDTNVREAARMALQSIKP